MATLSTARQFFDHLVAGGSPAIESLVTDRTQETEWLDFKSGVDQDYPKTLSESVCGFANNQGGVLVWGVDARKDKLTNVDAASEIKCVTNPAGLRSRLNELVRTSVEPPLSGIEIHEIVRTSANGEGFVVCFIPESDNKPHRAEMVKGKPYLIRIADAFINPSPSLLRSLFFPRSSAKLEISASVTWDITEEDGYTDNEVDVFFQIFIRNIGIVSANDVAVVIHVSDPSFQFTRGLTSEHMICEKGAGFSFVRPLHPSSKSTVCNCSITSVVEVNFNGWTFPRPQLSHVKIKAQVFSRDMQPLEVQMNFDELAISRKHSVVASTLSE